VLRTVRRDAQKPLILSRKKSKNKSEINDCDQSGRVQL
jgi:hypothetical protein